eukprot:CAMPEP_0198152872 /NCGR_PEP_ID=MMETSP1443-20131203/61529_1 /TAXON_ID=186043 /ORGANISM="Entomoneis sp., Strain CCMP2396" /LENGTH=416 /DNA_ID=CAMNT_0043819007 /DNA_START=194 /DNA_END=1444 /DNA_ORIENTATION=+
MKFSIAALLAVSVSANPFAPQSTNNAQARHVSKLLRHAKAIRHLGDEADEYPVDISGYSVKFEKCQFVKSYDDDLAEASTGTVLGTTRFAIFRLCPGGSCESCSAGYGEYILDLETYLQVSTEYFQEYQNEMCETCETWCEYEQQQYEYHQQNNNNEDRRLNDGETQPEDLNCKKCVQECAKIENMEDNGFVDATQFLECEKIYDDGDNGGLAYYAAPVCAQSGTKIKIGVFSDEYCQNYKQGLNVEDYLDQDGDGNGKQLSHALLKLTYDSTCISCKEDNGNNNNNNGNDEEDADAVNDFCENLYNYAGKCEFAHGFSGYYQAQGNVYYNQMAQEDVVCGYINSLKAGTYDETGEINISGSSFSFAAGGSNTTSGQKIALAFFVLGTVGLAVYAAMLHSKLTKGAVLGAASGALA